MGIQGVVRPAPLFFIQTGLFNFITKEQAPDHVLESQVNALGHDKNLRCLAIFYKTVRGIIERRSLLYVKRLQVVERTE